MKMIFFYHKAYRLSFLVLGIMSGCASSSNRFSNNDKKQAIIRTIQEELILHPKATLLDIYKNFFEGRFGPRHMISEPDAALNYLEQELQNAAEFDSVSWQAVGYEERYYRVNLSLVRDGAITMQDLITAFIESTNDSEHPPLETWENEWESILLIIMEMNLNLRTFEEDKLQISEDLKKGIIVGHHSLIYKKTYHPHYRIVSKSYFENLYDKVNSN